MLLTVGVAASVHLVERHLDLIGSGTDPKRAPGTAARMLARPMVLTTATTAAGFLALSTNSIPAVRRFGWFAAFGVAVAMAWALLVVPSLLRLFVRVDRHGRRRAPRRVAPASSPASPFAAWREPSRS
ncbi:MAG: MMPL family transporter [Planctomycetota bacterium]